MGEPGGREIAILLSEADHRCFTDPKASPALETFNDSAHFKAYAARAMHHLLIDRARRYLTREKHLAAYLG
jgi:hypothetical protein